jgi:methyl-accepting chemotaxis protein
MVEEQTAASHGLAREAAALFELLEQFRFNDAPRSRSSFAQVDRHPAAPAALKVVRNSPLASIQRGSAAVALKSDWEEF